MLTELCAELRNYFVPNEDYIHFDTFTIADGKISPVDFLQEGQYFRIVGSTFNDGVHKYADDTILADELFEGSVWAMIVPPSVIALSDEIDAWTASNAPSAYTSESFGGYSYSRATDSHGNSADWKNVFASRMNAWRKMRIL